MDCISWSTDLGGRRYTLASGDWFELDEGFIADVETAFDNLVSSTPPVKLPPARTIKIPTKSYFEKEYNKLAAKNGLVLLDTTDMSKGLPASQIEACDLLDPKRGLFIHVKDCRRSSLLSNLFNQGVVSLETFISVQKARENVRAFAGIKSGSGCPIDEPVAPSRLTVMFAIIDAAPSGAAWRLPFFSMLAAKHASERVGQRGAKMLVVRVDDQRP
jgi:uncharacterized protein (TIGR04141 family)